MKLSSPTAFLAAKESCGAHLRDHRLHCCGSEADIFPAGQGHCAAHASADPGRDLCGAFSAASACTASLIGIIALMIGCASKSSYLSAMGNHDCVISSRLF